MVVGVRKALEIGHVYSREELQSKFSLSGSSLDRVIDYLMELGCLRPVLFECEHAGSVIHLRCHSTEASMKWQALSA